jgi:hypothetical protein
MKIYELPINTLIELHFDYMGGTHKLNLGLFYKIAKTIYISAIKHAGVAIPAVKLKNISLVYKSAIGRYIFKDIAMRSISYNGQNLYAIQSEQDAYIINQRSKERLLMGVYISTKITSPDGTESYIQCLLKDIGMTGMGIMSHQRFEKSSKIEISFRTNQNDSESLVGSIIYIHEFANGKGFFYGCEFEKPNETIGKYVANQKQKYQDQKENDLE